MSTSDRKIHISLDALITVKDSSTLPCSITFNLRDPNIFVDSNTNSQNKANAHQESDCDNKLKQNYTLETKTNDVKPMGNVQELFRLPEAVSENPQNVYRHNAGVGSTTPPATPSSHASKDKLGGGGNKPISKKQKDLINKMANEQNKNVDELVNNICHKSLDELLGHEADKVIKSISKPRR